MPDHKDKRGTIYLPDADELHPVTVRFTHMPQPTPKSLKGYLKRRPRRVRSPRAMAK